MGNSTVFSSPFLLITALGNFRYEKKLGGGALIDAAGYTMKYAARLLGESIHVSYARMNYIDEFEVDMFGSGVVDGFSTRTCLPHSNAIFAHL